MASPSGSAYSAAREPEEGEWEALRTLDDVLAWARIGGAMDYVPSQRESLLIAAGGGRRRRDYYRRVRRHSYRQLLAHIGESMDVQCEQGAGRQLEPRPDYRPIRDHQGQGDLGSPCGSYLGRG